MTSRARTIAILLGIASLFSGPAAARIPERRFRESVSLDVDSQVVKKLGTIRDYFREQHWKEALDVVQEIIAERGDTLIESEPGRYVAVRAYCDRLLAGMPAAGLAEYRVRHDAQARARYEEALRTRAAEPLSRIVRRSFLSSVGDDALLLLGDRAWERGDLVAARRCWTQLVPLAKPLPAGEPLPILRYPDTDIDGATILARLVLCRIMEGDRRRAAFELSEFAKLHPHADGELAGRNGSLHTILAEVLAESRVWGEPTRASATDFGSTFGGNMQRNGHAPAGVDVGGVLWKHALAADPLPKSLPNRLLPTDGPLVFHPVFWKGIAFVAEANRIRAWNIQTGKPWPGPESEDGVLYPPLAEQSAPLPEKPVVGLASHTLTIRDGRLYARMGTSVIAEARDELRDLRRSLICLDLERGNGKLIWKVSPADVLAGEKGWAFEGTPVVAEGRCYVTLRRGSPETQVNAVCLDAETGRTLWNRRICAAVSPVGESRNLADHRLLALEANTLYHATGLGAIAAIDAERGTLRWVVTYESRFPDDLSAWSDPARHGMVPCVAAGEFVYAAPRDSDSIFAIHAASGVVMWQREIDDEVRHLLGVGGGNLIISGRSVWGLDARNGATVWGRPVHAPAHFGYGRGLLAGDAVWWPTRESIEVLSPRTGRRLRSPIQLSEKGATGGNLAISVGHLLIAGPESLTAFSEYTLDPIIPKPTDRIP